MVKANTVVGGISATIGYISGYADLFGLLLLCMLVDFISGLTKAFIFKKLSSRRCGIGVLKKTLILQAVILVHFFALCIDNPKMECLVLWFWIAVEMLSVLENLCDCGVPIPQRLKHALIQIRGGKNEHK